MINQETLQNTQNNPRAIIFPENIPIFLNNNILKQYEQILKATEFDIDEKLVSRVKNIKAAAEIVNYLINFALKENAIIFIQNVIIQLLINYKYEEIKDNRLLNKYEIRKLSEKEFTYKIGKDTYQSLLKPKIINNLDFNESIFLKIEATRFAINIALKNNHKQTAEELIKEVLKNADLHLTLFSRSNYSKYNEANEIITSIVSILDPEAQIHAFKILEKHSQQNFYILLNFSNSLLSKGCFDEVIELLENKLASRDNTDLVNGNINIGNCYYNLGLAYYGKANYQSAKQYYSNALEYLPNDENTIFELYKIYSKFNDVKNLKYWINNLKSKDIKNLLELSLDLANLSTSKVKSINKSVISPVLHPLIQNLEYIAKFNEGKFSNIDKIKVFKKLINSCTDNYTLLSTAIYIKQFDIAKEIIQKIPKKEWLQNKYLWELKTLWGLETDNADLQIVITNNDLHGAEAADVINTSNTALIANGDSISVNEKVENALKYDCTNETTLEIGIAAALLNDNKEKAKEYASQLSEEKQQEISTNYSKDNKAENIEQLIEQYDPKEIHAYHQQMKQRKISEISQKITNNKTTSSWNVDAQNITTKDVTFVGKYKGLNCFAKITEEVKNKLGNNLIKAFTRAIEKGITYCKTNINGIKFLQNKAVEVKIDGDPRLFTNIIYKNSQEELLINFDHYGNHNNVEHFANDHKLEILGNLKTL